MDDRNEQALIPFFAHEAEMARMERRSRREFWLTVAAWTLTAGAVLFAFIK